MQLIGTVAPDRPLLVLAVAEEAAHLGEDLPVLLTGMGKVNAATALATVLASGPHPAEVINLGTAGALRPGLDGRIHLIGTVLQHDLDTRVLRQLTGQSFGGPLTLAADGAVLATGDLFVSDHAARDRLAAAAELVDMEGYAVAAAAQRAGVPVRLVKYVSDEAGEGAAKAWRDSVDDCAVRLAAWVREQLAGR
ncbi:nucleosidase [Kitasatospora sp. GAS204B]|uniref:nucleosidase n=1 Tax=unclassified Kitasatospora TaxID=2633591 RepID=UPI002475CDBC|nr:nucleosidase [Kitasatospora sp. GAS204B]MDH6117144.1 adenosylhomocysteine nucleosidase [Kitasatospora sp. GAS204B]